MQGSKTSDLLSQPLHSIGTVCRWERCQTLQLLGSKVNKWDQVEMRCIQLEPERPPPPYIGPTLWTTGMSHLLWGHLDASVPQWARKVALQNTKGKIEICVQELYWEHLCASGRNIAGRRRGQEAVTMDTRGNPTRNPETGQPFRDVPNQSRNAAFGAVGINHWIWIPSGEKVDFLEPGSFLQPRGTAQLRAVSSHVAWRWASPSTVLWRARQPELPRTNWKSLSPWNSPGPGYSSLPPKRKRKMRETLNLFRLKIQDDLGILHWPFS